MSEVCSRISLILRSCDLWSAEEARAVLLANRSQRQIQFWNFLTRDFPSFATAASIGFGFWLVHEFVCLRLIGFRKYMKWKLENC